MGRLVYYDSVADGFKDTTNLTEIFGSTIARLVESEFGVFSREFNRSEIIQNFLERHPKNFNKIEFYILTLKIILIYIL